MYKIFLKDRVVLLTDSIDSDLTAEVNGIHKLGSDGELKRFLADFENNENRTQAVIYHHNQHELFQRFRSCYKNLLAAGGLVWNTEKTHFLTMCRLGRPDLPKGKVEIEETFEMAAIREVEEECGIRKPEIINKIGSSFHIYHLNNQVILKETRWFEMIYHGDSTPVPQHEENISNIRWFDKKEVAKFAEATYPSIKEILKNAGLIQT
ncbi:NUDIX domain-containing protein [Marinilabilia sp.]|uniref:NUDIX hydrolase n=1 Tax=Marinilabilia sp. TaxID=2021252 RepID=UPI0025C2A63B|nr:NUDIX domain-containing protein [Marinilabilia sp.]